MTSGNDPSHTVQLINRAWDGDTEAKNEFAELMLGSLCGMLHNLRLEMGPAARGLNCTEEDVSEIWLRMVEMKRGHARAYANRREFITAYYVAARNMLVDRIRRHGREVPLPDRQTALDHAPGAVQRFTQPDVRADRNEQLSLLHFAMNSLGDDDQVLVTLIYSVGLQPTEAFRQLEMPESSGRARVMRIKLELGRAMQRFAQEQSE